MTIRMNDSRHGRQSAHNRRQDATRFALRYQRPVAYYATLFHPAPVTIPNPAIHQVTFNENAVEPVPTVPMEQETLEELPDDIISTKELPVTLYRPQS